MVEIEMFLMNHILMVVAVVASIGFVFGFGIALLKGFKAGMGYGVDMTVENIRVVMERKKLDKVFHDVIKDVARPEDVSKIDITIDKYL